MIQLIVVPAAIAFLFLGLDAVMQIVSYRREQKRDAEKKLFVDRILSKDGEGDTQHPSEWDCFETN